jgi:hypothetical protein
MIRPTKLQEGEIKTMADELKVRNVILSIRTAGGESTSWNVTEVNQLLSDLVEQGYTLISATPVIRERDFISVLYVFVKQ